MTHVFLIAHIMVNTGLTGWYSEKTIINYTPLTSQVCSYYANMLNKVTDSNIVFYCARGAS